MQLFYAPDLTAPLYTLGEEESKHCIRVLRLRRGDTLHLTDGRGTLCRCEIAEEDAAAAQCASWSALPTTNGCPTG